MAGRERAAIIADDGEEFDRWDVARLITWAMVAATALTLAVWASQSELGSQRLRAGLLAMSAPPGESGSAVTDALLVRTTDNERETRKIAEVVRSLTFDRDRLVERLGSLEGAKLSARVDAIESEHVAARLASIERDVADLTSTSGAARSADASDAAPPAASAPAQAAQAAAAGAAEPKRQAAAVPASAVAPPASGAPQPWPALAAMPAASGAIVPTAAPVEPASSAGAATPSPRAPQAIHPAAALPAGDKVASAAAFAAQPKPSGFGVDLGSAPTAARLQTHWAYLRANQGPLFERLRALMTVRATASGREMHLIAGPFPSAEAAEKMCAALSALQLPCTPAPFEGQRLAQR